MSTFSLFPTSLEGVMRIVPEAFEDHRGEFRCLFDEKQLNLKIKEEDVHTGRKGVLRGLDGDREKTKIVSCIKGSIYFVVAGPDKKWEAFTLSERNRNSILVPPNYASGGLVLEDDTIMHYSMTETFDPSTHFRVKWNDPAFAIFWPIKDPILSEKDA